MTNQTPEAEAAPVVSPCATVEPADASASGLDATLVHLGDVSRLRSSLQDQLEAVHAARWSR